MSILLVDEGNTRAKFGLVDKTATSFNVKILSFDELAQNKITEVIFASVKSADNSILKQVAKMLPNANIKQLQTQANAFGLKNAYQVVNRLGVDRWLAMLGSKTLTSNAFMVIDAGTAVTIDAVTAQGQHLGGWILPNVTFSAQSLAKRSGKIELTDKYNPAINLGNITERCIFNGLYASHIALVKSLAQDLTTKYQKVDIFLAGGDCDIYQTLLKSQKIQAKIETNLIFKGMGLFIN
ncbi:type III pantothenate kinase [Catenovulum adriaticum]|uniref:Type III pantothenate kinase n=1 Tax=Catenovulum adriaticum TaxID=2984846 RepID=A0ABY7AMC5_9ALTE|nr:type III pantothenate kinase [Catenovulum sp. TS8]WAJ70644.1 type III pantothenate kinase [Catenovulum sp. TS8]